MHRVGGARYARRVERLALARLGLRPLALGLRALALGLRALALGSLAASALIFAFACGARTELEAPFVSKPPETGGGGEGPDCAVFNGSAQLGPLDVFMMLDTSGSMSELTEGGVPKSDVVRAALSAFFYDPESAGIGVSLGYFPIVNPNINDFCFSDDDCLVAGGCVPINICGSSGFTCFTHDDCVANGVGDQPCVPLGFCSNQQICVPDVGIECPSGLGPCLETGVCDNKNTCESEAYAMPAVPISPLPTSATTLLTSYDQQGLPEGGTPTLSALTGVIDLAADWLADHSDHEVIVVLATDGSPSACDPAVQTGDPDLPVDNVAAVAAAGVARGVRTFVIGVFAPAEGAVAEARLGKIASAGGTDEAFIVSTAGDTTEVFIQALNQVRLDAKACELTVVVDETFEPDDVWVKIEDEAGETVWVRQRDGAADCTAEGGFYYEPEPVSGAGTINMVLCPATCTLLGASPDRRAEIYTSCPEAGES